MRNSILDFGNFGLRDTCGSISTPSVALSHLGGDFLSHGGPLIDGFSIINHPAIGALFMETPIYIPHLYTNVIPYCHLLPEAPV